MRGETPRQIHEDLQKMEGEIKQKGGELADVLEPATPPEIPDLTEEAVIIEDPELANRVMNKLDTIVEASDNRARHMEEFNKAMEDLKSISKEVKNDVETKVWERLDMIVRELEKKAEEEHEFNKALEDIEQIRDAVYAEADQSKSKVIAIKEKLHTLDEEFKKAA
ncbi:MAG: hypothetical protein GF349_01000 [Candidatus Magasanikbacteria bacterium]|nr:hypothetical protein [Candidatus Magasanikbacteria bacterium]